jgi:hypothetical protein
VRWLTHAGSARLFNKTIDSLREEIGDETVRQYYYQDDRFMLEPVVDGTKKHEQVHRDTLIREINAILELLRDPDCTAGGVFRR